MPLYDYRNSVTGEIEEHNVKIADREQFRQDNPELTAVVSRVRIGDPILLGIRRTDNGFQEVLTKAKKAHPYGNIQTR